MSKSSEVILKKYPLIKRVQSFSRDVFCCVRVVIRKEKGEAPVKLVDLREYKSTHSFAGLTKRGLSFSGEELKFLIILLSQVKKEYFDGPKSGS